MKDMSKFIELTKRDSGKLLVLVDQIIWVADDVEKNFTVIGLLNGTLIESIQETADRILTLINKN
ncbi:hypothetical protein [Bacteroides ovatus]|jgi:hypothetical protein|uniref:Uncharacterized protein n=2 Tax=Bacteroides ovatus TaxID=28116 RepID=A0A395VVD3_BACOV|nr:hypothetical protein [Bacteroides ovatus]RGS79478.1 hypothetical protein DWX70_24380 [Bacteroides ovatus]